MSPSPPRYTESEFKRLQGELSGPGGHQGTQNLLSPAALAPIRKDGANPGPLSSRKAPREAAWAGYPEPRLCVRCQKRVTLGQALQAHTEIEDGRVGSRWVRHLAAADCEGLR